MNIQKMISRTPFCLLAWCALAVAPASGQTITHVPLYTFDPDSTNVQSRSGVGSAGAGDVNGDGFDDLIVGTTGVSDGFASGSARVFSGIDGSALYTFVGDSTSGAFGASVNGAGDVNGDGFDDLIVGDVSGNGSVWVYSGVNGSVLYNFDGDLTHHAFGGSVSGAGDVNGDGFDDLIVGDQNSSSNGILSGNARVYSGANGSLLYNFDGDSVLEEFGRSVSGAGDVNGDGFDDLIVGARGDVISDTPGGYARVYSGVNGHVLYNFDGDSSGDAVGTVSYTHLTLPTKRIV